MLAPWTLLSGIASHSFIWMQLFIHALNLMLVQLGMTEICTDMDHECTESLSLELPGTTILPEFWDTPRRPMITHSSVIHIRSQVKTRQSPSYKFQKIAKNLYFEIMQQTLHLTHLLKLLDKMYKYEMDPTRTVGATERTRDVGRTDKQMDRRTDGVKPVYPPTTLLCRSIIV